jgi:protein CrcB
MTEELRKSEERLQFALDAGRGVGIWDWDVPNDRVYTDERFALLYSVDPALAAVRLLSADFPFGTLFVNLVGCFFIGFVHSFATLTVRLSPDVRLFLTTGLMGGLTTYSSFNYETLAMFDQGRNALAMVRLFPDTASKTIF